MVSLTRAALLGAPLILGSGAVTAAAQAKPNFVFIITDDQDLRLGSMDHMPHVKRLIADEGTVFNNHFCTVSLCCPSRVSLLAGKAAHNTNVTDVALPYGGYAQFVNNGLHKSYLPIWLQDAGYATYYAGKLMNGFSTDTYNQPYPPAWNNTNFLLDGQTYWYYNSTMTRDNNGYKSFPGNYSTDMVADTALEYLDTAIASDSPFFVGVAPIAPHSQMTPAVAHTFDLPVPAVRHQDLFPNLTLPRTPSFNQLRKNGANYMASLPSLNATEIAYVDLFYRRRVQSLQAVDELVASVMAKLAAKPDVLANTYVIYTSDNGFHMGQHRLPPGKTCMVEEDINVPFVIRGPGVARGAEYDAPTTHTDIVPTLFRLANMTLRDDFDGEPMPVTTAMQDAKTEKTEHVNVEFWGDFLTEGIISNWTAGSISNNTYKHLRVLSAGAYDLSYTVWCTNEHELYDLTADPYQTTNIYPFSSSSSTPTTSTNSSSFSSNTTIAGFPAAPLGARLDALLLTLKACKGRVCTRPWETLHPAGDVASLADAMKPKYDGFYGEQQRKVAYERCASGYIKEYEGPLEPLAYGGAAARDLVRGWELWT